IVDQHLLSANAGHEVVPKMNSLLAQRFSEPVQIRYLKRYPVPATRRRFRPVGHRLTAAASLTRRAQQQAQVSPVEHRECWRRMHRQSKAQMLGVERNGCIDIVDDVTHTDCCHGRIPRITRRGPATRLIRGTEARAIFPKLLYVVPKINPRPAICGSGSVPPG